MWRRREFKASIDGLDKPDPANMVRLGKAYSDEGKYDEAIAQFDKVMAMPDVNPAGQADRAGRAGAHHPEENRGQSRRRTQAGRAKPDAPKPDAPKPDAPKQ